MLAYLARTIVTPQERIIGSFAVIAALISVGFMARSLL